MSNIKKFYEYLEDHAQAVCDNKLECLEWFVGDDTYQLYEMIMENMGIDDWLDEMSHRILEFDDKYYIMEEEDLLNAVEHFRPYT